MSSFSDTEKDIGTPFAPLKRYHSSSYIKTEIYHPSDPIQQTLDKSWNTMRKR